MDTAKDPELARLMIAGAAATALARTRDLDRDTANRRKIDRARALSVAETDAERDAIRAEARADHARRSA